MEGVNSLRNFQIIPEKNPLKQAGKNFSAIYTKKDENILAIYQCIPL